MNNKLCTLVLPVKNDFAFLILFSPEPFGWTEMSQTPQTDGSHYPERFQEPMHPYDSKPAAEKYFDFHTSATPLHVEQEPRMHRDSRYSRNLDKITSTLLELVARK